VEPITWEIPVRVVKNELAATPCGKIQGWMGIVFVFATRNTIDPYAYARYSCEDTG